MPLYAPSSTERSPAAEDGGREPSTAVAWIHLITFLLCQVLHDPLVERDVRHLVLWIVELAAVIVTMRRVAGLGWFWSSPAINVIARLWVTFLILSFNVATLNALTGWESLWFKASWGTLEHVSLRGAGVAVHSQDSCSPLCSCTSRPS